MCCYGKLEKKEKLPAEPNEEKLPIQLPYEDRSNWGEWLMLTELKAPSCGSEQGIFTHASLAINIV